MTTTAAPKKSLKKATFGRRRAVAERSLVKESAFSVEAGYPWLVEPALEGVDLKAWLKDHRESVSDHLLQYGSALFRGFDIDSLEAFEDLVQDFSSDMLEYTFRSTPRTQVQGKVYTSTEYPADQHIPMHNEMSYTSSWPMKIWFFCVVPAGEGGATPIADSRAVYEDLDPEIRSEFAAKKVMYARNYGASLDLPWQEVFQTSDKTAVEAFCAESGIELEWLDDQHLRTRQVCPAIAQHPVTGSTVWFNQAHLFHVSSLGAEIAASLRAEYGEEGVPRNTFYGDGTPIADATLEQVRAVYRRHERSFTWQKNDLLLLDNMLTAHGRHPFAGSRRVVVGMAEAMTHEMVAQSAAQAG